MVSFNKLTINEDKTKKIQEKLEAQGISTNTDITNMKLFTERFK